jgi:hypothetical protein
MRNILFIEFQECSNQIFVIVEVYSNTFHENKIVVFEERSAEGG